MTPCSGGVTAQLISRSVHHLAEALSHIQQGIERRFLQPPLGETRLGLERFGTAWKSVAGQTEVSTGEEDSKKEQKMKKNKKKDEDRESEGTTATCGLARPGPVKGLTSVLCPSDGSEGGRVSRTVLERWRESLQSCTSLSQVSPPRSSAPIG